MADPGTTDPHALDALFSVIAGRKDADPESSYTARLYAKGRTKIAQKVGEEAVEVVIAALAERPEDLAEESADLLYHLLVLWAEAGLEPDDIYRVLQQRGG